MIRRLLWFVLAAWIAWLVRAAVASSRGSRPEAAARGLPRSDGRMVRDRICDTFLPDDRALTVTEGATRHYFCSEKCRAEFFRRQRAAS